MYIRSGLLSSPFAYLFHIVLFTLALNPVILFFQNATFKDHATAFQSFNGSLGDVIAQPPHLKAVEVCNDSGKLVSFSMDSP